jgi:hypothetical protein
MNNILKVTKYQLSDLVKSLIIFYTIILLIDLFIGISISTNRSNVAVHYGGVEIAALIYIFIAGLNCFRSNFLFLQANNVSRKRFYYANIITLVSASAFMALFDIVIGCILKLSISYQGVFEQFYKKNIPFEDFLWSFSLFVFAASLGWLITMLYYRSGNLMKTIISLIPIFIVILLSVIDNRVNGTIGKAIVDFLGNSLGFNYNYNAYIAVFSFSLSALFIFALCFLLIRKAAIKTQ